MFNNPVTFRGKPIGPEEFLNRMVEALGIAVDRYPRGRLRKREIIEKTGCVPI